MLDWDKIIDSDVKQALNSFGFPPTLRAMHYRLYSLKVIPNTRSSYVSLSDNTARARESGILPIDCFADDTRQVIGDFPNDFEYRAPEKQIKDLIYTLKNIEQFYRNSLSRWRNQEHHVELWTEKKAMVRTFESILDDREILIVPFGGYTSITYHNDNCNRLRKFQDAGKKVHILYFGDVDPTGLDIQRDLEKKLKQYGMNLESKSEQDDINKVDFRRIALTEEQIREFKLPTDPDVKTRKKLNKDPRRNGFRLEHNGELFQVEIDALTAFVPKKFGDMVIDSVDQYFDEDIYNELMADHSTNSLHKLVNERVRFVD